MLRGLSARAGLVLGLILSVAACGGGSPSPGSGAISAGACGPGECIPITADLTIMDEAGQPVPGVTLEHLAWPYAGAPMFHCSSEPGQPSVCFIEGGAPGRHAADVVAPGFVTQRVIIAVPVGTGPCCPWDRLQVTVTMPRAPG